MRQISCIPVTGFATTAFNVTISGTATSLFNQLNHRSNKAGPEVGSRLCGHASLPRYTTATFDGQQLLSVMDGAKILPEGAPSQWSIFFGTEDLDKTLQTITEAGGTMLQSVEDTPFGRVATAGDPTGATFSLTSVHS